MTINERIQCVVNKIFDGNKSAFAKAANIAPTSISNYLSNSRVSKPTSDVLERIINAVDGLSAEWLLTGEGEMLKQPDSAPPLVDSSTTGNEYPRKLEEALLKIEHLQERLKDKEEMIEILKAQLNK